jgi:chromosome segregation protein
MKIKRLEVIGFKSFCDRSVVHFNEPITGIVGPNGCGKSNIVDAIRWCMGEQSAKHLRGGAMQDVIFAGSESRGPLGMCEVTLVFENDGNVPMEYLSYSEIAVTRKLYRDGTSEYLLNKTPCRLRDITDFFLGTGIGAKAYSIIEQGRVGMIVSSKPEDRRFLIEEAAGITKYKVKKKAAEKKMEATRQNLLRVSDVVAEIEKQLGSLRRQAQKAERYRQYKGELRDLELWSASQKWLGLLLQERLVSEAGAALALEREEAQSQVVAREADIEAARLEAAGDEERLQLLQSQLFELDNKMKLGAAQADHEEQKARERSRAADEAEAEIDALTRKEDEDTTALAAARDGLAEVEATTSNHAEEVRVRESRFQAAREAQAALQAEVDRVRADIGLCKADIAREEQTERSAARRRDELQVRSSRLGEEDARLSTRVEELRSELARVEERVAELRTQREMAVVERGRLEARQAELKALVAKTGPELEQLTVELHKKRSRRTSLEEIHAKYEGFARGTRAIMKEKESRWGIVGPIADVLVAKAEVEAAIEAVLGARLGAVVVESQEVGVDAVELLKTKREGRASFVPANRFGSLTKNGATRGAAPEGTRGWLIDDVKPASDELAGLVEHLFGDVLVVEDIITALDLWRAEPAGEKHTYVTLDGEVVERDGTVTGGSREAAQANVLAQKREIRELDELLTDLEARHAALTAEHTRNRDELAETQKTLETLRAEAHQAEVQLLSAEKDAQRHREDLERTASRLQVVGGETAELQRQADEAAREAEEAALALRAARDRLVALEDKLSAEGRRQVTMLEEVEAAQEALTAVKVIAAESAERRRALEATIGRLESEGRMRRERMARLEKTIEECRAEAEELVRVAAARREELLRLAEEHGRHAEEMAVARNAVEARRAKLGEAEQALKALRSSLDEKTQRLGKMELERQQIVSSRSHLEETIAERYRVDLSWEAHAHHLRPLAGDVEEKRARELRDLIDRMGEINLHAIEEYNALETRYTFLVNQKTDLETALAQLEEAIDRINKTSKKRFREVFDLVNAKFQEIFPRCFRGGAARLVLTDEENILESGIEIVAQPPGKKNATVELLSGGEKAMTAVALIFAIFLIKPSPFCLLDEVDAPLDEANVGRFNDLIREMTDRSQFIVITHNKRTMQIADTLYGVTMEEPGISKLVSVNLSQIGRDGSVGPRSAAAGSAAA